MRNGHPGAILCVGLSLVVMAGAGMAAGWFITPSPVTRFTIGLFVLPTAVSVWWLRKIHPLVAGAACGAVYGAAFLASWILGGHWSAYAVSGQLNPLGMIATGILVYAVTGVILGGIAGACIGLVGWGLRAVASPVLRRGGRTSLS